MKGMPATNPSNNTSNDNRCDGVFLEYEADDDYQYPR
jgi:hypothetical protein